MALDKEIVLDNGIGLSYHRIEALHVYVNAQNTIEVHSYISEEKREEEAEAIPEGKPHNVYKDARYFTTDYDPEMSIVTAYDYLKTLPEFQGAADIIDKWQTGSSYVVGDLVMYSDEDHEESRYECLQAHTAQEGWEPPNVPALWKKSSSGGGVQEWVQPTGAQDAYAKGDKVTHNGKTWTSDVDSNVWEPGVYGWTEDA